MAENNHDWELEDVGERFNPNYLHVLQFSETHKLSCS